MTSTSIQKRLARTVAQIFKEEVLNNNNSQFTFNDALNEVMCNGYFPTMEGYSMTYEMTYERSHRTFVQWTDEHGILLNEGDGGWTTNCQMPYQTALSLCEC